MDSFRAAIVGTGNIAKAHVTALQEQAHRVEIVAGVDVSAENLQHFCTEHNIPHTYTDYQKMLAHTLFAKSRSSPHWMK
jgi:predicted dehydrogenase